MSHHSTTIVVDFDDTLALTLNRDWVNASPNIELIEKLNALYDKGWTINIVTARGQLSCNGDSELASAKYRKQIEAWLYENKVKYTDLSFQKKLAAYYIDDKGITPEDFILRFQQDELKGGMSGAKVVYDHMTDTVLKTAKNTKDVIEWYTYAKNHFNTPEIFSVIGDTIKMEKLYPYRGSIKDILDTAYSFRNYPSLCSGPPAIRDLYVTRCTDRLFAEMDASPDYNEFTEGDKKFLKLIIEYGALGAQESFSHGDYSISNIMSDRFGKSVFLIDPIKDEMLLSSWVIDIAKLYMSIHISDNNDERLSEIRQYCDCLESDNACLFDVIQANVVGHYCRVFPYADKQMKARIILTICEMMRMFQEKLK